MANAVFVVWRESLETFLIIGILYAWLRANEPSGKGMRALLIGLAGGVGLALLLGWALLRAQDELTGQALDMFQTLTLLAAAVLITQMVLWMRKQGRYLKAQMHEELASARARSGFLGVAIVAALAVAREGAETVIFLYGVALSTDTTILVFGALAGFAGAIITSWILARGLSRLNLGSLLSLSSLLLLVLASALLVAAVDRLIGGGWLPAMVDPLWDTSMLIDDGAIGGKLLADFAGYRARPALMTLLVWAAYWLLVVLSMSGRGRESPRHD